MYGVVPQRTVFFTVNVFTAVPCDANVNYGDKRSLLFLHWHKSLLQYLRSYMKKEREVLKMLYKIN